VSEKVVILLGDELGNTCVYEILHVLIVFDDGDHCAYMSLLGYLWLLDIVFIGLL
jgi:hypothetical protein